MRKQSLLLAIGIAGLLSLSGPGFDALTLRVAGQLPDLPTPDDEIVHFAGKLNAIVREVTAYNVGVKEQTSDTPCIGAGGSDLCTLVRQGIKVCAANFVDLGTVLKIEEYGECIVLDRLNKRYAHRVDIAMDEDEIAQALKFGLQKRVVEIAHR